MWASEVYHSLADSILNQFSAVVCPKLVHQIGSMSLSRPYTYAQYLSGMLKAEASGYVVKTATSSELISAIRAVHQGDVYLYPSVARMLVEDYLQKVKTGEEKTSYEGLTSREREILMHIAEDRKNKEIADLLDISVRTVQAHRTNLMDKLGAHDRTELVKFAIRKGIIDI